MAMASAQAVTHGATQGAMAVPVWFLLCAAVCYRSRRVRPCGATQAATIVATQEVTLVATAADALEAVRPTVGMEVVRVSDSEASMAAVQSA